MSKLSDVPELAPRVIGLWETRAKLKTASALSDRAQDWLKAYASHQELAVAKSPVIEIRTQVRKPYRRFATERLRRFHREEYERCRVLVPQHSVKNSTLSADAGDYGSLLPAVPAEATLKDLHEGVRLSHAYAEKLRLRPIVNELKQTEEQFKSQLEAVVAYYLNDGKWDGTAFTFEDGWTYGSRIRKFSSDEALRILPADVVEQYSEMVPEQVIEQVLAVGSGERSGRKGPDANPFEGD